MPRVALATSEKWARLTDDDASLFPALKRSGVEAMPAVWSDARVDWRSFDLVIIRSCWDYHRRTAEFREWIDRLERDGVRLFNPPAVLRWNMHKSYLFELAAKGIRIPRTRIITEPRFVIEEDHAIVKPAISASSYETHRVDGRESIAATVGRVLPAGDVIVQEFVDEIVDDGEWSLMFFDRVFSHAVRKRPKPGDFRVQSELGGSAGLSAAPPALAEEAQRILDLVDGDLLYARVDAVERNGGLTLMELELLEPSLFLRLEPRASERFAEAIRRRL